VDLEQVVMVVQLQVVAEVDLILLKLVEMVEAV
jgi:hypothetical protein